MALPVEIDPIFGENRYAIQRSLRFRASATAYLNRTPTVAGNSNAFTISFWCKRGTLSAVGYLFNAFINSSNLFYVAFLPDNTLQIVQSVSGTVVLNFTTTAVYRDPSSFYHFVISINSAATGTQKCRLWVNGVENTVWTSSVNASFTAATWNTTNQHYIGQYVGGGAFSFDGYLAEINAIDGTAVTSASSFGQYNEFGVWSPQKYGGSYGTNGFYLQFTDIALTSGSNAGLGKDFSGNTNYWNTNNISVTTGTTYDAMTDVPPPPYIQNIRAANYATFNAAYNSQTYSTLSEGNLKVVFNTNWVNMFGTISFSSGKYYWEASPTIAGSNEQTIGVAALADARFWPTSTNWIGYGPNSYGWYSVNGNKYNNNSAAAYAGSYTNTDIIGVAFDADNGTITFYKNGTSQGTAYTGIAANTWVAGFAAQGLSGSGANGWIVNFGQRPFSYTLPSGYLPLNSNSLPSPTIPNGATEMAATLYTGTGATQSINNGNNTAIGTTFQPDLVWTKSRSNAYDHYLVDSVRGASISIYPNLTSVESSTPNAVNAFNSNGFTTGSQTATNGSGATFVGWNWNAGSGSSTVPTGGTITPTGASINVSAGFSILTYSGNGVNGASIAHGLGVAPSLLIVKRRNSAVDWYVGNNASGWDKYLLLNTTAAATTGGIWFGSGTGVVPTSTLFYLGGTGNAVNEVGGTYVCYAWAPVSGYSSFGSYTGTGNVDGPLIYTGFRPRWVMYKRTDTAGYNWTIQDTSTSPYNVNSNYLQPNTSNAEASAGILDFISSGIKVRNSDISVNASGGIYIYAAFAENPFKFALSR